MLCLIASHRIASHRIASHRIASHRTSRRLLSFERRESLRDDEKDWEELEGGAIRMQKWLDKV